MLLPQHRPGVALICFVLSLVAIWVAQDTGSAYALFGAALSFGIMLMMLWSLYKDDKE